MNRTQIVYQPYSSPPTWAVSRAVPATGITVFGKIQLVNGLLFYIPASTIMMPGGFLKLLGTAIEEMQSQVSCGTAVETIYKEL